MAYNFLDLPITPVTIDILTDEDLSGYTSANVRLFDPTGAVHDTITDLEIDTDALSVTFTFPTALDAAGIWNAQIQLVLDGVVRANLDPSPFVVDIPFAVAGWHSLSSIRAAWPQAPTSDVMLFLLLDVARQQCTEYAPDFTGDVPSNLKFAQGMQARNLSNANQVSPGGSIGDDSFTLNVHPLDWQVTAILRPKRGVPNFG